MTRIRVSTFGDTARIRKGRDPRPGGEVFHLLLDGATRSDNTTHIDQHGIAIPGCGCTSLMLFKGGTLGLISYAQSPRRENSDRSSPGEVKWNPVMPRLAAVAAFSLMSSMYRTSSGEASTSRNA